MYQSVTLEISQNILRHKLHKELEVISAGFVIQPNLLQLVTVSSSWISDKNIPK